MVILYMLGGYVCLVYMIVLVLKKYLCKVGQYNLYKYFKVIVYVFYVVMFGGIFIVLLVDWIYMDEIVLLGLIDMIYGLFLSEVYEDLIV